MVVTRPVEVGLAQDLDDVGDRVLGQQHAAEDRLLGVEVLRGQPVLRRRVAALREELLDGHLVATAPRVPLRAAVRTGVQSMSASTTDSPWISMVGRYRWRPVTLGAAGHRFKPVLWTTSGQGCAPRRAGLGTSGEDWCMVLPGNHGARAHGDVP